MFENIGAQIVTGAIDNLKWRLSNMTAEQVQVFIDTFLVKYKDIPIVSTIIQMWDDIKAGYNLLTPEQRAEFWKDVFLVAMKLMEAYLASGG